MLTYSELIELRDKLVNGEIGFEFAKAQYWTDFKEGQRSWHTKDWKERRSKVDNPGGLVGAVGHYQGGVGKPIEISKKLAEQLEKASPEDRQAALLALVSTILHESVHYGDWSDGSPAADNPTNYWNKDGTLSGTSGEVGAAFESEVYHNGDFWETEESEGKIGESAFGQMKKIIREKSKNDDDKKDIPTLPSVIQNLLNSKLNENPDIIVTIK